MDIRKEIIADVPVAISHVCRDISELVYYRLGDRKSIVVNTSAQPNSHPHLGTVTTIMTAFAIAKHLGEKVTCRTSVTFDILENAKSETKVVDELTYQRSLADTYFEDAVPTISRADHFMDSFKHLLRWLEHVSYVPYRIRSYREFQAIPTVRLNLILILDDPRTFSNIVAPSDGFIHIRFPCPLCKWVEKNTKTLRFERLNTTTYVLSMNCFEHGRHESFLDLTSSDYFDTGTAVRDIVKIGSLVNESENENALSIMVDGVDWSGSWSWAISAMGACALGYEFKDLPIRFFTPAIVDWSGSKFSKSVYVASNAYSYLDPAFLNYQILLRDRGEECLEKLWEEIERWVQDPKRLFRNYSLEYIQQIVN